MRSWRNWQTRKTKDLVGNSMQVQFLSTAPKTGKFERKRLKNARFLHFTPFLFLKNGAYVGRNYTRPKTARTREAAKIRFFPVPSVANRLPNAYKRCRLCSRLPCARLHSQPRIYNNVLAAQSL